MIINRQINTYKYRKRKVTTYNYVRKTNQSNICILFNKTDCKIVNNKSGKVINLS